MATIQDIVQDNNEDFDYALASGTASVEAPSVPSSVGYNEPVSQTDVDIATSGIDKDHIPGIDGYPSDADNQLQSYYANRKEPELKTTARDLFAKLNENPKGTPEQEKRRERRHKAQVAIAGIGDVGAALANFIGAHKGGSSATLPADDKSLTGKYQKNYEAWRKSVDDWNKGYSTATNTDYKNYLTDVREQRLRDANAIKTFSVLKTAEDKAARRALEERKTDILEEKAEAQIAYQEASAEAKKAIAEYYDKRVEVQDAEIKYKEAQVNYMYAKSAEAKAKAKAALETAEAAMVKAKATLEDVHNKAKHYDAEENIGWFKARHSKSSGTKEKDGHTTDPFTSGGGKKHLFS